MHKVSRVQLCEKMKKTSNFIYYIGIMFVVFFWGLSSVIYSYFYDFYSASVLTSIMTFFSFLFFLVLGIKKLKYLNTKYFTVGLPICALTAFAGVLQRIGLQYTTPAHYAFLEHISCVVVPVTMFIIVRKRPSVAQIVASASCLLGCFIMSGMWSSLSINLGDILCLLAGVLYGVCAALLGTYAKDLDITLYMIFYTFCYFAVSFVLAVSMNFINIGGAPMEKAVFTFDIPLILLVILVGIIDIAICWMLRNLAVQHIDPSKISVISPFSAVITGVVSVIFGIDHPSFGLLVGGTLIMIAALLPVIYDIIQEKKQEKSKGTDI